MLTNFHYNFIKIKKQNISEMETLGSQLLTKIFVQCKDVAFTKEGEWGEAEKFLDQIRLLEQEGKPWPIPVEMLRLYVNTLPKDVELDEYVKTMLTNPRKYDKKRLREFSNKFLIEIAPGKVNRCARDECSNVRNLKICKKCKIFTYCSVECQKIDWPNHKVTCRDFYKKCASKILI